MLSALAGSFCTVGSVEPRVCPSSPDSALTSLAGSAHCGRCADGFYRQSSDEASLLTCKPCPANAICINDATLDAIQLRKGFWRLSPASSMIYACRGHSAGEQGPQCVGGVAADKPSPHTYCAESHKGPRCEVCTPSRHHFAEDTGKCIACNVTSFIGQGVWIGIAVFAGISGVVLVAACIFKRHRPQLSLWAAAQQLAKALLLVPIFKQLFGFFQITSVLNTTYEVEVPDEYTDWMRWLSFGFDRVVLPGVCVGGVRMRLVLLALIVPAGCVGAWLLLKAIILQCTLHSLVSIHAI